MMTPIEQRTLRLGTKSHTATICVGFAVMVVGGLYGIWGARQLDPEHTPDPAAAFDRPIVRLVLPLISRDELGGAKAESELEKKLLERLAVSEDLVARLLMALIRLLLSLSILSFGLVALVWGLSARSFARVLSTLIATGELVPAGSESTGDGSPTGVPRT